MQITREILDPQWHVDGDYATCSFPTKISISITPGFPADRDEFFWEIQDSECIEMVSGTASTIPAAQAAAWAAYLDLIFHPAAASSRPSTPVPYTIETAIDAIDASTLYGRPLIIAILGNIYSECWKRGVEVDYEHYVAILIALDVHRTEHVSVKSFDSENMLTLETHAGDIRIRINTRYLPDGIHVTLHLYEGMDQVFAENSPLPDLIQHLHDFFTHKL